MTNLQPAEQDGIVAGNIFGRVSSALEVQYCERMSQQSHKY